MKMSNKTMQMVEELTQHEKKKLKRKYKVKREPILSPIATRDAVKNPVERFEHTVNKSPG